MKKKQKRLLKLIPLFIVVIFIILAALLFSKIDFEDVVAYTPHNRILAAVVLWFFYALKSLSVVVPATVFFIAAGHIYPYPVAVIINIIGLAVSFAIPYFIGRFSGADTADAILEKYPKAKKIADYGHNNNFFTVYISRAITVVPNDLVSMLHGSVKMPFPTFVIASVVGILPEMLVETYIGGKLSEFSLGSLLSMLGLIALTCILSIALNKKLSKMFLKRKSAHAAQQDGIPNIQTEEDILSEADENEKSC